MPHSFVCRRSIIIQYPSHTTKHVLDLLSGSKLGFRSESCGFVPNICVHYFRGERARDRAGRGAHESAGRKRREPHGARHFGTVLDLGRDTPRPLFLSLVSDQMGFHNRRK